MLFELGIVFLQYKKSVNKARGPVFKYAICFIECLLNPSKCQAGRVRILQDESCGGRFKMVSACLLKNFKSRIQTPFRFFLLIMALHGLSACAPGDDPNIQA